MGVGLVMPPDGRGHICGRSVTNLGIFTDATDNHCIVHCNTTDIIDVYWGGEDAGVQLDPEMAGEGPHTGIGG